MRKLLALLVPCAGLLLAACGGGDGNDANTTTAPAAVTRPAAASFDVTETDFKLDPANPKLVRGGLVRFTVRNAGKVEHSLAVEGPNGEVQLARALAPGQRGTLEATLSRGTYEWYCPIGNHRDEGMEGEITVN